MKTASQPLLIHHGTIVDGRGGPPIVDGDVVADISLLEDRTKFIAVMQGGIIKAGQFAKPFPTIVKQER